MDDEQKLAKIQELRDGIAKAILRREAYDACLGLLSEFTRDECERQIAKLHEWSQKQRALELELADELKRLCLGVFYVGR
jgi:hypothetical protein